MKLTLKQARFCMEYVANGGNATQAYRKTHDCERMNPSTVHKEATRLYAKPLVAPRIEEIEGNARVAAGLDREWVLSGLMRASEGEGSAAVNAMVWLGKELRMFKERSVVQIEALTESELDKQLEQVKADLKVVPMKAA